jgi:hypothetical protein
VRKFLAITLAAVACSASLTLTTAAEAAAAGHPPRCVKVRKYFDKDGHRYVRLANLCARRASCFTVVIPHHKDKGGRLSGGATKDVYYGKTATTPRALYVKNVSC